MSETNLDQPEEREYVVTAVEKYYSTCYVSAVDEADAISKALEAPAATRVVTDVELVSSHAQRSSVMQAPKNPSNPQD